MNYGDHYSLKSGVNGYAILLAYVSIGVPSTVDHQPFSVTFL